ncbi:YdcH family protein [Tabrizicola oligotrophica]|uniref:DUF465 domain-containing protein n=1 Tax=Tabrizicola oligotrophica TaxID=2710650 RepID=A0A6M0QVL0_9RHOB|nr:DUF465 domain-containing protein [Tabrizicola oligotrophica]NEY91460.1 DUF465 domain-containing protein [Tabrizicola oligotrophica]
MSHTPHALAEEFPEKSQKISALKEADAHFAKLVAEYDAVNDKVHRAESRLDLLSEEAEEHLRKQRSHLKDHIWQHLK